MPDISNQPLLVSIIMPFYNAERYISSAVTSILQERSSSLEILVVNDGSTDASLQKLHKIQDQRLKIINNKGIGIADAMNTGLAIARGDVIARCDADDLYPVKRLVRQVEWLSQNPEFGAVCGSYSAIDPRGIPIIQLDCGNRSEDITEELRSGTTRTHLCTFAIRTKILRELGGFRRYFTTSEDIDLQLRLSEVCKVWYLPDVFYHYRVHSTSITHTKGSTEREFFDRVARDFQKQRHTLGKDALQQGRPPLLPSKQGRPFTAAQHIQGFLLGKAWREYHHGQKLQALATGVRSAIARPGTVSVWRSVLALVVKLLREKNSLIFKSTLRS